MVSAENCPQIRVRQTRDIRIEPMFGNVPVNTMSTHWRRDHARESDVPLWVAGQRIKIFLALLPSAVHLDTPPGSGNFAF